MTQRLARHAPKVVAAAIVTTFAVIGHNPDPSAPALDELSAPFSFTQTTLPSAASDGARTVRQVHPSLDRIAGWISSVGAAIALNDLDGDGLANDYCLVDPRHDAVTVGVVPGGTTTAYRQVVLPTPTAGFDPAAIAPMGCLPADVNADGHMDLVVYYWGRTPVVFEHAGGVPARSSYRVHSVTDDTTPWFTNAAVFADVDGDGHGDLLFGNYFADGAGILDVTGRLPVHMQHSMSRATNAGTNRLLMNLGAPEGRVQFQDASQSLSDDMVNGWTLAMGAADLDGDLLPEIYIANDFGSDRLLHNRSVPGKPSFVLAKGQRGLGEIRSSALGRDSFKGMGVDFGDVDHDGHLDIYVSNIAEEYGLLETHFLFTHTGRDQDWQRNRAPYRNASGRLGLARSAWSWDAKLADLDNDGQLEALQTTGFVRGLVDRWPELQELAMANDDLLRQPWVWPYFREGADLSGDHHDRFFAMGEDGRYHDIAAQVGLGQASVSRALAMADVDGDGDLDFAIARQWDSSTFYRNDAEDAACSLVLDLRMSNSNGSTRPAIGAVSRFVDGSGQPRIGFVDGGNGHSGRRSTQVHFGLRTSTIAGDECPTTTRFPVTVSWRDARGIHERTLPLQAGTHHIVLDDIYVADTRTAAATAPQRTTP